MARKCPCTYTGNKVGQNLNFGYVEARYMKLSKDDAGENINAESANAASGGNRYCGMER